MAEPSHRHRLRSLSSESISSKINGFSDSHHHDHHIIDQEGATNRLVDDVVITRRVVCRENENIVNKVYRRNNEASKNVEVKCSNESVSAKPFGKNGISDRVVGEKVRVRCFSTSEAASTSAGNVRTICGLVAVIVCLLAFNERIVIVSGDTIPGLNYGKKR